MTGIRTDRLLPGHGSEGSSYSGPDVDSSQSYTIGECDGTNDRPDILLLPSMPMTYRTRRISVFQYAFNMALAAGVVILVLALIIYLVVRDDVKEVRSAVAAASRAESSPLAVGAFLAAEDPEFFRHPRLYTLSAAMSPPGRASLTLQLVRARLRGRGLWNAFRELLIATTIDAFDSKETIARAYSATVYLGMPRGEPVYGVQEAAPAWFGVPAGKLTPAQAATLAAAIRSPSVFSPRVSSDAVVRRRMAILESMRDSGVIDAAEFENAERSLK